MGSSDASMLVGAVAYHERVIPIWESFKNYFSERSVPTDYVLYSSYERLVDALLESKIDIGWNTNTAYVRLNQLVDGAARILGMRDVDSDFASIIVTRRDDAFGNPKELSGRKLALGSRDSGHAAILPLYFLFQEGLDAEAECELIRFDTDMGKHGDTGDSEMRVVREVASGRADAGALGAPTWSRLRSEGFPETAQLQISWRSPTYFHCNFTALPSLDGDWAARWTAALLAMEYNDPKVRPAMDLEGVKRWLPGDSSGYETLTQAMHEQGYLT
jgi:phosphonate transport system substrate-binding protein